MLNARNPCIQQWHMPLLMSFYIRAKVYLITENFGPNLVRVLWECKNKHDFSDIQKIML